MLGLELVATFQRQLSEKMPPKYRPPVVIGIHGIRTHAVWYDTLRNELETKQIITRTFRYGYFSVLEFLIPSFRKRVLEKFHDWFESLIRDKSLEINLDDPRKRPSVVAHSFGTWVVGNALLKYEFMKCDKIILCGSILPRDFEWETIHARDQVDHIRNEFGAHDIWTKNVKRFVANTGDTGRAGFRCNSALIVDKEFREYEHSSYFTPEHIRKFWCPALQTTPSRFTTLHGSHVASAGEYERILRGTREIDDQVFAAEKGYAEQEPTVADALKWTEANPDIYTFLLDADTRNPVAYLNAMPVTNELANRVLSGKLRDNEVSAKDILSFTPKARLRVYLMSIARSPIAEDRPGGLGKYIFEKLMNSFFDKLVTYARNKQVIVQEVLTVAWTDIGKRLCKACHMNHVGVDKDSKEIYKVDLVDAAWRVGHPSLRGLENLLRQYRRMTPRPADAAV